MAEGQFLGSKDKFTYTTDSGKSIVLTLDTDLVMSNSGLAAYDAASPPANVTGKFNRFKPRGVYWQATAANYEGRRKFLIAGTANAALYTADAPTTVTVDGIAGITTGKRGESYTL